MDKINKNNLKRIRRLSDKTQQQVADDIFGKSKGNVRTYQRYETGERTPDLDTMRKISNYFNSTIDDIWPKNTDNKSELNNYEKSAMLRESTPQDDLDREIQEKFKEAKIPCYGAVNAAGETIILNEEGFVEYVDRPPWLAGNPNAFAVRVYGESMGRVYRNGMTVFVAAKKRPAPHDGCVIEMHTGEAYLKEYIGQNEKEVICQQYEPEKKIKYPIEKVKAIHKVDGTKE